MKIKDLNETYQLDELNLGITRKGREIKRASKAAKTTLGDEARQMEVELAVWMKHSGLKRLTVDDLQNYFGQKGLGDAARPVLTAMPAKSEKKAAKIQSKADKKAAAQAAAGLRKEPSVAAPSFKSNRPPATVNKNFDKNQKLSSYGKVGNGSNTKLAASMYEAEGNAVLTRREVKSAIQKVLQAAYKSQANFGQSQFAQKKKK